jgi:cob(I)alamin adenosyltransferase
MSITTKRGDSGTTDLLFGQRVSKTHPRMAALGSVDELNAALGFVRLHSTRESTRAMVARVQQELIAIMGVVAVMVEDYPRYEKAGFLNLAPDALDRLTQEAQALELALPPQKDWVLPGSKGHVGSTYLDFARTVSRRAEREIVGLAEAQELANPLLLPYFNRLSDLLWLLARVEETSQAGAD